MVVGRSDRVVDRFIDKERFLIVREHEIRVAVDVERVEVGASAIV